MGLDNNIHIIGIGADGESKFRKFFLDKDTKGNEQNNGLTLHTCILGVLDHTLKNHTRLARLAGCA